MLLMLLLLLLRRSAVAPLQLQLEVAERWSQVQWVDQTVMILLLVVVQEAASVVVLLAVVLEDPLVSSAACPRRCHCCLSPLRPLTDRLRTLATTLETQSHDLRIGDQAPLP